MNDIERSTYWWKRARAAEEAIDRVEKVLRDAEKPSPLDVCTQFGGVPFLKSVLVRDIRSALDGYA